MEKGVVAMQGLAEATDNPPLRWQGLLQSQPAGKQQYRAETGEYAKDAAPAHDQAELPTEDGGDDGRQSGYQDQTGEEDHQRTSGIEITRDGARNHQSGRTGQALDEAQHDQDRRRGRQGTRDRSEHETDQPDDQRPPPTKPIR